MTDDDTLAAVRDQVIHLAAALDHDDDAGIDEALDELSRLLDITDDDMDAFEDHYHQFHAGDEPAPIH
jgi:hypothetical protein